MGRPSATPVAAAAEPFAAAAEPLAAAALVLAAAALALALAPALDSLALQARPGSVLPPHALGPRLRP